MAERVNGILKTELLPARYESIEEAMKGIKKPLQFITTNDRILVSEC
jgi:hypothetical protein